jgi:hypothetical protein
MSPLKDRLRVETEASHIKGLGLIWINNNSEQQQTSTATTTIKQPTTIGLDF